MSDFPAKIKFFFGKNMIIRFYGIVICGFSEKHGFGGKLCGF